MKGVAKKVQLDYQLQKIEDRIQLEGDLTRMLYGFFRLDWKKFEMVLERVNAILENYEIRKKGRTKK